MINNYLQNTSLDLLCTLKFNINQSIVKAIQ